MAKQAKLTIEKDFQISKIDKRIYGSSSISAVQYTAASGSRATPLPMKTASAATYSTSCAS